MIMILSYLSVISGRREVTKVQVEGTHLVHYDKLHHDTYMNLEKEFYLCCN